MTLLLNILITLAALGTAIGMGQFAPNRGLRYLLIWPILAAVVFLGGLGWLHGFWAYLAIYILLVGTDPAAHANLRRAEYAEKYGPELVADRGADAPW